MLNLPYTFLWRPRSARIFLYLSKLATQMVTSTPLENLSLLLYEPQNKNFNFGTTKTLILYTWSIFFRGGHIKKIWSKKIFFMKTLSKLGALTVSVICLSVSISFTLVYLDITRRLLPLTFIHYPSLESNKMQAQKKSFDWSHFLII